MRLRDLALLVGGASVGMFAYGMLVESKRLVIERKTLRLRGWPKHRDGYRIAVLSDFHIRGSYSVELAARAIDLAIAENPDLYILPGDFLDYWMPNTEDLLLEGLARLQEVGGRTVAVPGNHDYKWGDFERLPPVLEALGIRLLRNEVWHHDDIAWAGIDSAKEERSDPVRTVLAAGEGPIVAIWHEPDLVALLPEDRVCLQISGHSHGGQWRFPGGFTPRHSILGRLYPRGWYPQAPTPLYVTRGVGTTGPPARFNCPPEVTLLTLTSEHEEQAPKQG